MEAFTVLGEWWLPETPELTVHGTLTFDPDSGARLHITGALRGAAAGSSVTVDGVTTRTLTLDDYAAAADYPRIVGVAENKPYTLEHCFAISSQGLFGLQARSEEILVNQILIGVHFEPNEVFEVVQVTATMDHFVHWVQPYLIVPEWVERAKWPLPDASTIFTVTAFEFATQTFAYADTVGELRQLLSYTKRSAASVTVTQDVQLRLRRTSLTSFEEMLSDVTLVQHLSSMGTNRVCAINSLNVFHPDVARSSTESTPMKAIGYAGVLLDRELRDEAEDEDPHKVLFSLSDIGGAPKLAEWLSVGVKYRSALQRVMHSRYRHMPFSADRLLHRAAALESFDRKAHEGLPKRKPKVDFADRMRYAIETAGKQFDGVVGDPVKWVTVITKERNDIAHHLDRNLSRSGVLHSALADSAYYLFVMCMLRAISAPEAVFDQIVGSHEILHLKSEPRRQLEL